MFQHRIQGVFFTGYTGKELQSLAVKKIDNPETFDQLLHPNANGLYDHALGPSDKSDRCDTCSLSSVKCPGHFGYIQLPLPVYHPLFFKLLVQVLKGSCFTCHRFIPKMSNLRLFTRQCDLLDHGFLTEASVLSERYGSFTIKASENSATDVNLQQVICDQIDEYYHSVVNSSTAAKTKSTKNLVKCRQEILKDFIKVQLLKKIKQCPHCDTVKRNVRSEYNTRLYFSSASQKAVQKAVTNKLIDELKKNVKKEAKQEVEEEEENAPEGDLLEDEEEEEEDEDIEEEDRKVKMKQEATNRKKSEEKLKKKLSGEEYITPNEVKKHILELWSTEYKVLKSLFGSFNCPTRNKKVATPEIFFLDIISVPPSRFRPMLHMGDKAFENPQTANLNKILWKCKLIEELLNRLNEPVPEGEVYVPVVLASTQAFQKKNQAATIPGASHKEQLKNAWEGLQVDVNTLMDNTLDKLNQTPVPGIRQLLEKKEGLFRKNMMGKRVNFACRSVISPDPYINMDEIGVPLVFASKLTYAQPVTSWNVEQLKRMVINGPNKWPGAVMIESEDGRKTMLSENEDERRSVAKKLLSTTQKNRFDNATVNCEKKVHRHLINGDVMLLNRQPTLHRPSIMAHKAKVLPGERTLRMHYANCKSYNADFDGDEMNAHFPQNELGRSEAYNLVSTNANYLSPKDGKPLAGLIQDHVVSGVWMTSRDKFFTREEYQQLIFNALIDSPGRITTLPPCILKPIPMWSGKQIFSSVLLNIIPKGKHPLNMKGGKAKVCDNNWPTGSNKRVHENYSNDPYLIESQVIIREGQLMTGVLDKTQYGSTQFGLVHCVYELYGGEVSGLLLSVLARLFTAYLQHTGFTLGIHDILVLPSAETRRRKHLTEGRQCGDESAMEALNVAEKAKLKESMEKAQYTNAGAELAQLDLSMKQRTDKITNKINTECIKGLVKKFPDNSLQLMVQSGAKGSTVNCMQISCLLGQIELEGRRPPLSLSGRSLPSFLPHDTSPRAGGFVDGRFLTGIRPQEYFFHCMAGREGLIDTAVKTSRSGYLQRCLIKHLEALYVHYDMSVRDGDGSVVQFLYGDDGIDVLQNLYLKIDQYKTIVQNYKSYKQLLKPAQLSQCVEMKKAVKAQRKLDRWRKRHGEPFTNLYNHQRKSPFNLFEDENKRKMAKKYSSMEANKFGRKEVDEKLIEKWKKRDGPNKQEYLSRCPPCPDPVLSRYNAQCYFGAVSERFAQDVDRFVKLNPENTLVDEENEEKGKISSDTFKPLMLMKYLKSTVHPGEAVGLLASQSIGEPSTQMTLNTFHFAGQSDMNVTLGIPRLREILMTASENIKTPQMDILVRSGKEEEAKSIAKRLNRVTLIQVLEQLSVYESLARTYDKTLCRQFRVHLQLLPQSLYEENFVVTPQSIMRYIESVFIKRVCQATTKIIRTKEKERLIDTKAARNEYRMQSNNRDNEENEAAADEEEEEDFSDEENADGDATNMKERNRQKQFSSYDDPEERNAEIDEDNNEEESIIVKKEPLDEDEYTTVEVSEPMIAAIKQELNGSELRINNVLKRDRHVTNYKVCEKNSWCEFTLQFPLSGSKLMLTNVVEKLAEKSVVYEAAGITRSMVSESKAPTERGRCRLKTEGVSMQELWKYPEALDLKTLYSNNIHSVAKTYGIEAARSVLIKEVQDVFKVYGIQIDVRHLSLVGDYMTFEGVYKPFNRIGIETNSFPFQKMSFETSTSFLRTATAFGEPDDLGSPSSRIVVGRVIGTGTGLMELLPKIS